MAFRRFRRRNRGLWFPTSGDITVNNTTNLTTAAVAGNTVVASVPIIGSNFDAPADVSVLASTNAQLAAALGQSYMVKRIVGKIFVERSEAAAGSTAAYCFAGIITTRVSTTGVQTDLASWNPFLDSSTQKRWLWRRTWKLWGSGAFGVPTPFSTNYGQNGSSVQDGPHVDCKMKARVTWEERLFLVYGMQNAVDATAKNAIFAPHLRLFASVLRADNR